jgi:hypothetical protein
LSDAGDEAPEPNTKGGGDAGTPVAEKATAGAGEKGEEGAFDPKGDEVDEGEAAEAGEVGAAVAGDCPPFLTTFFFAAPRTGLTASTKKGGVRHREQVRRECELPYRRRYLGAAVVECCRRRREPLVGRSSERQWRRTRELRRCMVSTLDTTP